MRLTLRALLAYMDEILEPEDAEAISKKIEESEFASDLLHRTRDCMRRLRLGAPKVTAQGVGLDPNTVAEYLDNTLSGDRVTDFEKVCLESDVHLAEVASCHQVLTLVLGEPADVDPRSRQRMYRLADLTTSKTKPPVKPAREAPVKPDREAPVKPAGEEAHHAGPPPVPPPRIRHEHPDYIRAASRRRRLAWGACAVVVLLAAGGFGAWQLGWLDRIAGPLAGVADRTSPLETEPAAAEPTGPIPSIGSGTPNAVTQEGTTSQTPLESAGLPAEPAIDAQVAEPGGVSPVQPDPGTVASRGVDVSPEEPGVENPLDVAPVPAPQPQGEPAPLPAEAMGSLAFPTDVLLKLDAQPDGGTWQRVPDDAVLNSGETFLCLPSFRSSVVLGDQLRLMLVDETRLTLLPADEQGVFGLKIDYGHLLIGAAGQGVPRVRLQIEDRAGLIEMGDAQSLLAVTVSRGAGSAEDPETQPTPMEVDLYAHSGSFRWQEIGQPEPVAVDAPQRLRLNDRPLEAVPVEQFPDWIEGSETGLAAQLEQRASVIVKKRLQDARPVSLTLSELSAEQKTEVRSLALRCLAAIGDFEPLVNALNDPNESMTWPEYFCIDELRAAVRRGPAIAGQVRTAMEQLHGPEGADLYTMLWKYQADNFREQDATLLGEYLVHDALALRRLSSWNLKSISGGASHFYRPQDPEPRRIATAGKWIAWIKTRFADAANARPGDGAPPDETPAPE